MSKQRMAKLGILVLAAGLLALGACKPSPERDLEKSRRDLMRRAQAFWTAKANQDNKGSYAFLEPEWKVRLTPEQWAGSFGLVNWENPVVKDAKIEGNVAIVAVEYDWAIQSGPAEGEKGRQEGYEYWVRIGDVWYKEEPIPMEVPSWEAFPDREETAS